MAKSSRVRCAAQRHAEAAVATANRMSVFEYHLRPVLMTPVQEKRFLAERHDLVIEAAIHNVTQQDIVALAYRKKQLAHFERLLSDPAFFEFEACGDPA